MPGRRYEPEVAAQTTSRRLRLRNATSRATVTRPPRQSTPSISKTVSVASEQRARSKEGRDTRDSLTNVDSKSLRSSSSSSASGLVHFASRTKRVFSKLVKPNSHKLRAAPRVRSQDVHTFHYAWFETPPLDVFEKKERESPFARFGIGSRRTSSSSDSTTVDSCEFGTPTFREQCSLDIPPLPDFLTKALAGVEGDDSLVWAEPDDLLASIFPPAFEPPGTPRIPCVDLPACDNTLPVPSTLDLPRALADRLVSSLSPSHPREPSQPCKVTSRFSDWTPTVASVSSLSNTLPSFALDPPSRPPPPYSHVRTLFPPRPSPLGRIDSGEEVETNKRDEEEARKAREALKGAFTDLADVRLLLKTTSRDGQRTGRTSETGGWDEARMEVSRGRSSSRSTTTRRSAVQHIEVGAGD